MDVTKQLSPPVSDEKSFEIYIDVKTVFDIANIIIIVIVIIVELR